MNKSKIIILVLIFLVIVEGILILYYSGGLKILFGSSIPLKASPPSSNPLLTFQSSPIQGKITKVSGKNLYIQDTKGINGVIEVSDNVSIIPASDDKKITLNKDAVLTLQDSGGGVFVVNSIMYIPDFTQPVSTNSATVPLLDPKIPPPPPPATPSAKK